MNKYVKIISRLLCVILLPVMLSTGNVKVFAAGKSYRIAKIDSLEGEVKVQKAGGEKAFAAFKGMSLSEGDTITTGTKSSVTLFIDDDKELKLDENSKLNISELNSVGESNKTGAKLWFGKVFANVKKKLNVKSKFEIKTPTTVAGARGTMFFVGQSNGTTDIAVLEGTVGVISYVPAQESSPQTTNQPNPSQAPQSTPVGRATPAPTATPRPVEVVLTANRQISLNQSVQSQRDVQVETVTQKSLDLFMLQTIREVVQAAPQGAATGINPALLTNIEQAIQQRQVERDREEEKKSQERAQATPTPTPFVVADPVVATPTPAPTPAPTVKPVQTTAPVTTPNPSESPVQLTPITAIAAINGIAQVGYELTAGVLTPLSATASYQWQISGTLNGAYSNISGATGNKYIPSQRDANNYIRVTATGIGNYTGTVSSPARLVSAALQTTPPLAGANGIVKFTGGNYSLYGYANIRVTDDDKKNSGSVFVTLINNSDQASEISIPLSETRAGSGVFEGTAVLYDYSDADLRKIKASLDDTITVSYLDEKDSNNLSNQVRNDKISVHTTQGTWRNLTQNNLTSYPETCDETSVYSDGENTYLAFIDEENKLKVLKNEKGNWTDTNFQSSGSGILSFNISGLNGIPYIIIEENLYMGDDYNALSVLKYDGSGWSYAGVHQFRQGACKARLALDLVNGEIVPYVAFVDTGDQGMASVMKFDNISNTWSFVGNEGFSRKPISQITISICNGEKFVSYSSNYNNGYNPFDQYNPDNPDNFPFQGSYNVYVEKFNGSDWSYLYDSEYVNEKKVINLPDFYNYSFNVNLENNKSVPYISYITGSRDYKYTRIIKYIDGTDASWQQVSNSTKGYNEFEIPANYIVKLDFEDGIPYVICYNDCDGDIRLKLLKFNGQNWEVYPEKSTGYNSSCISAVITDGILYTAYNNDNSIKLLEYNPKPEYAHGLIDHDEFLINSPYSYFNRVDSENPYKYDLGIIDSISGISISAKVNNDFNQKVYLGTDKNETFSDPLTDGYAAIISLDPSINHIYFLITEEDRNPVLYDIELHRISANIGEAMGKINSGIATLSDFLVTGISNVNSSNISEINAAVGLARLQKQCDLTRDEIQIVTDNNIFVPVVGFNADLVANGSNDAKHSTSNSFNSDPDYAFMDSNNYVYYESGYISKFNNQVMNAGLPQNRIVSCKDNAGILFKLSGYNNYNALFLEHDYYNGSLALIEPKKFSQIYFLAAATDGGWNCDVTLHYQDGSQSDIYHINISDWCNNPGNESESFGRISRNGDKTDGAYPTLFDYPINSDPTKILTSIEFTVNANDNPRVAIFAIGGRSALVDTGIGSSALAAINSGNATLQDYTNARVANVNAGNIAVINSAVSAARAQKQTDLTLTEIQLEVDKSVFIFNPSTHTITGYTGNGSNLIIPSKIGGTDVLAIGDNAFMHKTLLSLIIPNGVISIGANAFWNCYSLRKISIPASVTSIGSGAFGFCTGLEGIAVDEGNSSFSSDSGVLYNKDKTKLIQFPLGSDIENYTLPDTVNNIDSYAFKQSANLENINVNPANEAFSSDNGVLLSKDRSSLITCPSGKTGSYTVPEFVTIIDYEAFRYSKLTIVNIPSSTTTISDYAFTNCYSLTDIKVDGNNPNYCDINGVLFNKPGETIIAYPLGKNDEGYSIPNSVKTIGKWAFTNNSKLHDVIIPEGVLKIEENAFWDCGNLVMVTIPSSVTNIENNAFRYCVNLTSILFKGNAPSEIGSGVFDNHYEGGFIIYYYPDKTGFTSPTWLGYPCQITAQATPPTSAILASGDTNPVGGVIPVDLPENGATSTSGAVTGWLAETSDRIKFTVTDAGGASSTITINGEGYINGSDYKIMAPGPLNIVVTTEETGKLTCIRTFVVDVKLFAPDANNLGFKYNDYKLEVTGSPLLPYDSLELYIMANPVGIEPVYENKDGKYIISLSGNSDIGWHSMNRFFDARNMSYFIWYRYVSGSIKSDWVQDDHPIGIMPEKGNVHDYDFIAVNATQISFNNTASAYDGYHLYAIRTGSFVDLGLINSVNQVFTVETGDKFVLKSPAGNYSYESLAYTYP